VLLWWIIVRSAGCSVTVPPLAAFFQPMGSPVDYRSFGGAFGDRSSSRQRFCG